MAQIVSTVEALALLRQYAAALAGNDQFVGELQLYRADLVGVDLSGLALSGARLIECNLHKARLSGADLSHTLLAGCSFEQADLQGATLHKADCSGATFRAARLCDVNAIKAVFREADLALADLSNARLGAAKLSRAQLQGAILQGVDLELTIFEETQLYNANVAGARNVELALLRSADVGPPEEPDLLVGDELRRWLLQLTANLSYEG